MNFSFHVFKSAWHYGLWSLVASVVFVPLAFWGVSFAELGRSIQPANWLAIVGAVVFTYLETYAIGTTIYWQFVLGAILVVLVMTMPAGIVGTASWLGLRIRRTT